jgi:prolyl-tRNA editing enzyme YbaK/EbsC (Cys-tRNA(Pro) deacylase)
MTQVLDSRDLASFIAREGIVAEIVRLQVETPTVEAAAAAVGVPSVQIGKSLLFLAHGEPLLVIANGTTPVAYKRLADHLAIGRKRLRLANAEQVLDLTGYPVGTVPPFGHRRPLATLLERGVLDQQTLFVGGGEINALLRIDVAELGRVTGAQVVDLGPLE